jgi:hypothetical protein
VVAGDAGEDLIGDTRLRDFLRRLRGGVTAEAG